MNASASESLLDQLEKVSLRLRCGQTITQAVAGLPELLAPTRFVRLWFETAPRIRDGEIPGQASIEALLDGLRLEKRVGENLATRTTAPRMQARILTWLGWIFWAAASLAFPNEMRPGPVIVSVSAAFLLGGQYFIRRALRRAEASLWFSDWSLFLARVSAALRCGHSIPRAWSDSLFEPARPWPDPVSQTANELARALGACEEVPDASFDRRTPKSASATEEDRAMEQMRTLHALHREGRPLGETLDALVKRSLESFEQRLLRNAERLSVSLMGPLFACYLPAYLVLLFGPILSRLISIS